MTYKDYWNCEIDCRDCSSFIDGKKPYQYYNTTNCKKAQSCDILRRERLRIKKEESYID